MVKSTCRTAKNNSTCLKKGSWSPEEDKKLINYIKRYSIWNWAEMATAAGLLRGGKSCRLRWMNYLRPGIKHGNFSQEEDEIIINLHRQLGNRWSTIALELPGRTDNEIKNHWHSHLKKHCLLQGNLESNQQENNSPSEDDDDPSVTIYKNQFSTIEENNNSSGSTYEERRSLWDATALPSDDNFPVEGLYMVDDHAQQSDDNFSSLSSCDPAAEIFNNQTLEGSGGGVTSSETYGDLQSLWDIPPFPMEGLYMVDEYHAQPSVNNFSSSSSCDPAAEIYNNQTLEKSSGGASSVTYGDLQSLWDPAVPMEGLHIVDDHAQPSDNSFSSSSSCDPAAEIYNNQTLEESSGATSSVTYGDLQILWGPPFPMVGDYGITYKYPGLVSTSQWGLKENTHTFASNYDANDGLWAYLLMELANEERV